MSLNAMSERDVSQRRRVQHSAVIYTVPASWSTWLDGVLQGGGVQVTPVTQVDRRTPPTAAVPADQTVTKTADTKGDTSAFGDALSAITDYIPSETVLIYTFLGTSYSVTWSVAPGTLVLFGVLLSMLLVYVLAGAKGVQQQVASPWVPSMLTVYNIVAAGAAFWAWLNALPYFGNTVGTTDGLILVVVTVLLGFIGKSLDPK
ncbi:hypothetical protein [Deinococcus yunweiensis]|uniref:hypothetical protein n=1 Tax=Deinococcus yunweiensis TaxID=367282 RepID=UPI00398EE2FF